MITFLAKETKLLEHKIGKEKFDPLLYEFVHLCIFVFSMVYILLTVFVLFALIKVMFRYWAKIDNKSIEMIERELSHVATRRQNFLHKFNPYYVYRLFRLQGQLYHQQVKKNFIEANNLPQDYNFARYLRKRARILVVHLLELSWRIWVVFLFAAILFTIIGSYSGSSEEVGIEVFIAFGWAILLLNIALNLKIHFNMKEVAESTKDKVLDVKEILIVKDPAVLARFFQVILLLESIYLTGLVMMGSRIIVHDYSKSVSWLVMLLAFAPPFITALFFIPISFPQFVLITSVGNMLDQETLEQSLKTATNFDAGTATRNNRATISKKDEVELGANHFVVSHKSQDTTDRESWVEMNNA
eukprot:CAMPEP_0168553428 /NCGR_PEP_ID=MMETSP0413-20121227/7246_1 /TAXON_ID=136452 /ORGANISM="Filamoeba nolandi, Strain NC-AS-23-1" /LENGTH=356 /DNA_ID=CAMNT_0008584111 /DNA_START=84 /DNA_END=1150 /DNA_ORIENTATION=+